MHSYEYFGQRVIRGKKITIKKSLFVNNHFFMFSEIQNVHLACISKLTSARDVDHGRRLFSRHGATLPNRNPKPDKSYEIVRSLVRERERERAKERNGGERRRGSRHVCYHPRMVFRDQPYVARFDLLFNICFYPFKYSWIVILIFLPLNLS